MTPEQRIAKHNLQPYLELIDPGWAHRNQFDYMEAVDAAERVRAFVHAAIAAETDRCCGIVYGQCSSDVVAERTVRAIRGKV